MDQNKQADELKYITSKLLMEFQSKMVAWNEEYSDVERDLGIRASFAELWRKAKKIKAAVWDGADTTSWRESVRTILFEIIGHAFLMLYDLDHKAPDPIKVADMVGCTCPNCGLLIPTQVKTTEDGTRLYSCASCNDTWAESGAEETPHDQNLFLGAVPQKCPKPGCGYRPSLVPAGNDRFA